jgi:hypothetical protein
MTGAYAGFDSFPHGHAKQQRIDFCHNVAEHSLIYDL